MRLFLCDGVGLGKTIQAGLVLTELIARRLAHRILIVSPAGPLLEQWRTEMSQRFGLRLEVIDEAHHCMETGRGQDREDSQRRRLAEVLARRSDSFLLATATPHDGNDRPFGSPCELLDPSLVDGRGSLRGER